MMERNIGMIMGVVFFQKKFRNLYYTKYQKTYSNRYYVIKNDYIKETRIRRKYSGRKQRATGYVYLNGSPYCDAEVSSQIISCLHDAIINAAPRIGKKLKNWNIIDSFHL